MTDQRQEAPFGYFRAEPFGWTDCAPDDDGAIPLYERPQSARIAELEAEVERLRMDAERYRYLRNRRPADVLGMTGPSAGCWIDCDGEDEALVLLTEHDADLAIDAARAKQAGGGVGG